ncbi:MAG: class I SAM-dependent methyltransferase [Xenococcaceae cyanobacterium MO_188.B32]|nr:class I SAM-dependent methyltransferase [Xenococcaceae cyanobacterium MO_188.B32]
MTVEKLKLQQDVTRHYNSDLTFDYESVRLTKHAPIEFALTTRYLNKMIPDGAIVVDVGVGTGHYAEFLAKRDCNISIYLVDLSQRLLEAAYTRLKNCHCDRQILGIFNISATDLKPLLTSILRI